MKYDLHIHSRRSDGAIQPEKVVEVARARGLDGIAITDHNTIRGSLDAKKAETPDFEVIIGSEIATRGGDLIGLFLHEEIKSRGFAEAISEIHEQDGIAIIPHPFDVLRPSSSRPSENEAILADAIEVLNSRCLLRRDNDRAMNLARKLNLGMTAGSDAHLGREIGNAGIITDASDLRKAIRSGDLELFGHASNVFNQCYTIAMNTWRGQRRG
ncbi:MAG TPA: PHP domain-containing protein [Methanotrichaceae archaeon]|nr:PHP domain-containing protein [Methanotrichaceae archaeon]